MLCQSVPKSFTATAEYTLLFSCAIPANAVPTGKSLRVTTFFHGSSAELNSLLYLNGVEARGTSGEENDEQGYSFTLINTGGTGFSIGGTQLSFEAEIGGIGPQTLTSVPAIPWTTGWTLAVYVAGSGTAVGDTFIVEIIS